MNADALPRFPECSGFDPDTHDDEEPRPVLSYDEVMVRLEEMASRASQRQSSTRQSSLELEPLPPTMAASGALSALVE